MGHSRRFLNLIVDSRIPGVRTLSRIDLTRQQLFYPAPPPPPNGNGSESAAAQADAGNEASTMGRIRLSPPSVTFRASAVDNKWRIHCFPLADRRVLCADQSGRTFLFDADTRHVATMPSLHKPKRMPFFLFVPGASADSNSDSNSDSEAGWDTEDYVGDGVGSLFVMDGWPDMEPSYSD
ncbi:uncharacterized protein LOC133892683 [Phragmites australis]|uniref:uncharacterized protein LOC133892683 n=1 Tax=Phragmites australis TaxID=29695 RepID=UPI002D77F787|nr:uncharacterized protein LOC133892683 [Phragmites australis]